MPNIPSLPTSPTSIDADASTGMTSEMKPCVGKYT